MKKRKINSAFIPIFSGIKPTANMTLPTYLRQLQYIEKVLNTLIKEINENFDNFDSYLDEQIGEIEQVSANIVRDITMETINQEASIAVNQELVNILSAMDDLDDDLFDLNNAVQSNTLNLSSIQSKLTIAVGDIQSINERISSVLSDTEAYTDLLFSDAKEYTDTKITKVNSEIDLIKLEVNDVNTLIDNKLSPISTKANKNEQGILAASTRMNEIDAKIDRSNTTILSQRISDVDNKVVTLNNKVDNLESSTPDLTELTGRVNDLRIVTSDNSDSILNMSTKVNSIEDDTVKITTDLNALTGRVDLIEGGSSEPSGERIDLIEADLSNLDGRTSSLEKFRNDYNNVANIPTRLGNVESKIDEIEREDTLLSSYPEHIKFPDGIKSINNNIKINSVIVGETISYEGLMVYDYSTLTKFNKYESLTGFGKPLNVPSSVSYKSQYPQNPVINYDIKYKNSSFEVIEINGVDLRTIYQFNEIPNSIDGYVVIESSKLNSIYNKMVSDNATDVDIKISIQCNLTFEKRSD